MSDKFSIRYEQISFNFIFLVLKFELICIKTRQPNIT